MPTRTALSTSTALTPITADHPKGQKSVEVYRAQYNGAGLDEDAAQRLNESKPFAAYLAEGIRRYSAKQPDYTLAQSVLGTDFITPEEIAKARGVVYSPEQIESLANTIPPEDTLRWCRDNGYAIMAAPPTAMSLLDVRSLHAGHFYSKEGGWYSKDPEKFSRDDKTTSGWLAIRKDIVPKSTSKNWNEQQALLSGVEYVPNAAEMSWFVTTYFEVRGIRLLERIYVRTSSLDSDGHRVNVGDFDAKGLDVYSYWGDLRNGPLGLASARK